MQRLLEPLWTRAEVIYDTWEGTGAKAFELKWTIVGKLSGVSKREVLAQQAGSFTDLTHSQFISAQIEELLMLSTKFCSTGTEGEFFLRGVDEFVTKSFFVWFLFFKCVCVWFVLFGEEDYFIPAQSKPHESTWIMPTLKYDSCTLLQRTEGWRRQILLDISMWLNIKPPPLLPGHLCWCVEAGVWGSPSGNISWPGWGPCCRRRGGRRATSLSGSGDTRSSYWLR